MAGNYITLNILAKVEKSLSQSESVNLLICSGEEITDDERIAIDILKSSGTDFRMLRLSPHSEDRRLEEYTVPEGELFVSNPDYTTIKKLSLGMIDSEYMRYIWRYIISNKSVYLNYATAYMFEGMQVKNRHVLEQLEVCIRELERYGVVHGWPGPCVEKKKIEHDFQRPSDQIRQLITEKDIRILSVGESLRICVNTIITPLAKDMIRAKDIKLIEVKYEDR